MNEHEIIAAAYEMTLELRRSAEGHSFVSPAIRSRWIELRLLKEGINVDYSSPSTADPFCSRLDRDLRIHIIGDDEDEPGLKFSLARTLGEAIIDLSTSTAFGMPAPKRKHQLQGCLFPEDPLLLRADNPLALISTDRDQASVTYATAVICPPKEVAERFRSEFNTCKRLMKLSPVSQFDTSFLAAITAQVAEEYMVPRSCAESAVKYAAQNLIIR